MGKDEAAGKQITPLMSALIGGVTGAIEISITYPTEYLKTCMQLYPDINKKGMINYSKETFASKGFFGKFILTFRILQRVFSFAFILRS